VNRLAAPDLTRIFEGETVSGLSEYQLLERYRERHDEIAFEALVARLGPMVLGVCRRMLVNPTDVEDAFQATFLVLVRRAGQLGPRDSIGPWLHGVAARVALRARAESARRHRIQPVVEEISARSGYGQADPAEREMLEVLDSELSRLPSKYRAPVVLCYLQGQTHEDAARLLNWPLGTVKGRLARARDLLRSRLTRRGLAPTTGGLAVLLSRDSSASLQRELLERTVRSSLKLALGQTTAQVVSTSVASLVEGVLTTMLVHKIRSLGFAVLISAVALTGAGVMARQAGTGRDRQRPRATLTEAGVASLAVQANAIGKVSAPKPDLSNTDLVTDAMRESLLPADDPRQQFLKAARVAWDLLLHEYASNSSVSSLDRLTAASRRLLDARMELADSPEQKISALEEHKKRIRDIARLVRGRFQGNEPFDGGHAHLVALAAEAELLLAQAGAGADRSRQPGRILTRKTQVPTEGSGKDPRSRLIASKLDELVAMNFAQETALEDVLKYIKQSTKSSELPNGLPIYIDPLGLQEAERTEQSTIKIDLEGVPLRRTLQLLLRQLGLAYFVRDGMIYITSQENEDEARGLFEAQETSPIMEQGEKAVRGELPLEEMKNVIELFKTREQLRKLLAAAKEPLLIDESGALRNPSLGREEGRVANDEVKKLSQQIDELRKNNEKITAQLAEMQKLVLDLLKSEREARKTKATTK
jgi:RNA polymerase sigma factor (sigma-70 family)